MKAQWYVIHVGAGSENRVSLELREQFDKAGLADSLQEVFVPKKQVSVVRRGTRVKAEDRIIPGYVFVRMVCTPETVHVVRRVPRVVGILGNDPENPRPLTEQEAKALMSQTTQISEAAQHAISFESGEIVKVCSGLFASMQGVVESVIPERERLRVSISILGRSTPVDLDFSQVEKV